MTPCGHNGCPLPQGHTGRCIEMDAPAQANAAPEPHTCRGPECSRVVYSGGLCRTHYVMLRRKKALGPITARRRGGAERIDAWVNSETAQELDRKGPNRRLAVRAVLESWADAIKRSR